MKIKNHGGPAFPRDDHVDAKTGMLVQQNGMTLLDYFAAAALQGILASTGERRLHLLKIKNLTFVSYSIAEAMVDVRANRTGLRS